MENATLQTGTPWWTTTITTNNQPTTGNYQPQSMYTTTTYETRTRIPICPLCHSAEIELIEEKKPKKFPDKASIIKVNKD